MTAVDLTPQVGQYGDLSNTEQIISWNVKILLTAQGKSQADLARILGISRATMTNKLKSRISWSLLDAVKTARFLNTTVDTLLDDSLMRRMGVAEEMGDDMEKSAVSGGLSDDGTPRGIRTHNPRLKRTLL